MAAITGHPIVEKHLFTSDWEDYKEGSPQSNFLHSWRRENLLAGGRGTRKTGALVAKAVLSACVLNPGSEIYITEQTGPMVDSILLPRFRKFINPELYRLRSPKGQLDAYFPLFESTLHFRSRQAKNQADDPPFRGPDADGGIFHDELARDKNPPHEDKDVIAISAAMLRGPAKYKTINYTTTPQANWFWKHCLKLGITGDGKGGAFVSDDNNAAGFYARTRDVDPSLYADLVKRYSVRFASQELEALWVPMEGLVWEKFASELWPAGNLHWATWDPAKPWHLGMDLGQGLGHWQIWQYQDPIDQTGRGVGNMRGRIAVAVAEGLQYKESISPVINRIAERFARSKKPASVSVGHDVNTSGSTGPPPSLALSQRGWPYSWPQNESAEKSTQHGVLDGLICNTAGERRWCVSESIIRLTRDGEDVDDNRSWGLRHMLTTDTFPDDGVSGWFRKDKRLAGISACEDVRDSTLYMATLRHPPDYSIHDRFAA